MVDTWKTLYPKEQGYTFIHKVLKKSSRIDYILLSRTLYFLLSNANVSSLGLTDHFAVVCRLEKCDTIHGPGRWFCDNRLLKDKQCINRINNLLDLLENPKR